MSGLHGVFLTKYAFGSIKEYKKSEAITTSIELSYQQPLFLVDIFF